MAKFFSDILSEIVELKKQEVTLARQLRGVNELESAALLREDHRDFYAAMSSSDEVNIIAEIKRASPSKGDICVDLDPAKLAKNYEAGGAKALSVLTERNFFKGGAEDMQLARQNCSLPVLRKDFTISDYQIYESAALGADAVLLIVRLLEKQQLKDYVSLAHEMNLSALVEVHCDEDIDKLEGSGAKLVGVNNRDLKSFNTSLEVAVKMAKRLAGYDVVAASGIFSRTDVEANLSAGINRFLIGESLVRCDDAVEFLRELRGV